MRTILAAGILSFFSTCKAGNQGMINNNNDTVLLYKADTLITIGAKATVLTCRFSKNAQSQYSGRLETVLLLDNPEVMTAPDGVYELYMADQPPSINNDLVPSHGSFVTVLDLYSITAPAAKKRLEVNISEPIKKLFLPGKKLPVAYISIRFGAIKLADGSYASNAGELRLSGIRIVQIKNK